MLNPFVIKRLNLRWEFDEHLTSRLYCFIKTDLLHDILFDIYIHNRLWENPWFTSEWLNSWIFFNENLSNIVKKVYIVNKIPLPEIIVHKILRFL